MMSMLKDLPFADHIAAVLVVGILWCGAHVLYVGPEVIAPRLTEKYYRPQCRRALIAHLQADAHAYVQRIQRDHARQQRAAQRDRDALSQITGGLVRQYVGEEFAEMYKNSPIAQTFKGIFDAAQSLQNLPPELPDISVPSESTQAGYCACLIAAHLSDRLAVGLFSASLRLWKPETIVRLENLSTALPATSTCPRPRLS